MTILPFNNMHIHCKVGSNMNQFVLRLQILAVSIWMNTKWQLGPRDLCVFVAIYIFEAEIQYFASCEVV